VIELGTGDWCECIWLGVYVGSIEHTKKMEVFEVKTKSSCLWWMQRYGSALRCKAKRE
jgi:hypothetical protein